MFYDKVISVKSQIHSNLGKSFLEIKIKYLIHK